LNYGFWLLLWYHQEFLVHPASGFLRNILSFFKRT
jgi:hypothetical protein